MKQNAVILSVAFNFHDSNLSLSIGPEIVACVELEKFFRAKRLNASPTLMEVAADHLLTAYGLSPQAVDYLIVNADNNPYHANVEEDISECNTLFLGRRMPTLVVRHHCAHAGYFFLSKFASALAATCDGGGDLGERVAYFECDGLTMRRLSGDFSRHISTTPYGQFSTYLYQEGFCAGRLMGLSAHGQARTDLLDRVQEVFPKLRNVSFREGQAIMATRFPEYKGMARQDARRCADLAYAVQTTFELLRVANLQQVTTHACENLVITGGSALNLNCNTAVFKSVCRNLYIPPCCDDTGIAVGQNAVAIANLLYLRPFAALPYLCIDEDARALSITKALYADRFNWVADPSAAAKSLAENNLALCHIGRPETGPRALGHRSFLMSAASDKNRQLVSETIKGREWYRPVAPIVLEDDARELFTDGPPRSEYMLFSYRVADRARSLIPAVVHVDGTARIQTIGAHDEPYLYELLREYKRLSGLGVLINTSLNLKGQPISQFLWDTVQMARRIHCNSVIIEPCGSS